MKINLTNGVSWGAKFKVDTTDPIVIEFVGVSGKPVSYDLAIVCSNATYTKANGVYTFRPSSAGVVNIVANRNCLADVEDNVVAEEETE